MPSAITSGFPAAHTVAPSTRHKAIKLVVICIYEGRVRMNFAPPQEVLFGTTRVHVNVFNKRTRF